ncbi:MAG: molybdenum cofactor biosynthesis protein [Alphaproteobacteria bacterium HGW-Alphaproteobacteria-2]|nr:MAG: molybdenum cofactor biosynthesis protein [Alphaproteobacteria bacterium HGW-Alphaproteobacteria-2]
MARDFIPVRIAVLTVSDTRSLAEDRSGDTLAARIEAAGHVLAARDICRDERAEIAAKLREWCADPGIDVILSTGGTGLTGRDVTVEAHRDVYEKEIEAFATVFTIVSMRKIGTSAVQSRATGGVAQGTYLFALPQAPPRKSEKPQGVNLKGRWKCSASLSMPKRKTATSRKAGSGSATPRAR